MFQLNNVNLFCVALFNSSQNFLRQSHSPLGLDKSNLDLKVSPYLLLPTCGCWPLYLYLPFPKYSFKSWLHTPRAKQCSNLHPFMRRLGRLWFLVKSNLITGQPYRSSFLCNWIKGGGTIFAARTIHLHRRCGLENVKAFTRQYWIPTEIKPTTQ